MGPLSWQLQRAAIKRRTAGISHADANAAAVAEGDGKPSPRVPYRRFDIHQMPLRSSVTPRTERPVLTEPPRRRPHPGQNWIFIPRAALRRVRRLVVEGATSANPSVSAL